MSAFDSLIKTVSVQSFDTLLRSLGVMNIESYDRIINGFLNPVGGYVTIGKRADEEGDSLIGLLLASKVNDGGDLDFSQKDIKIYCYSNYMGMGESTKEIIKNIEDLNIVQWNPKSRSKKCSSTLLYGLLNSSIDLSNTREVAAFLNFMPAHAGSNLIPYLDVEIELSEFFKGSNVDNNIKAGTYKFLFFEKTDDTRLGEFDKKTLDLNGIKKVTSGETGVWDGVKYSYVGMDTFTTPQPFYNQGKGTAGYLDDVNNPFSPIATLNSLNITVTPAGPGGGTHKYKTAKLEFMIHDRSRLDQFSSILDPSNANNVIIWLTYGWRYKNYKKNMDNDPYSDFINGRMLWKEGWRVITSTYSMEGQGIRVSLDLSTEDFNKLYDIPLTTFGSFSTVKAVRLQSGRTVGDVLKDLEENLKVIKRIVDLNQGSETASKVLGGVAADALALKFPGQAEDASREDTEDEDDSNDMAAKIEKFISDLSTWTEGVEDDRYVKVRILKVKRDLDEIYAENGGLVQNKFKSNLKTQLGKKFKHLSEFKTDPFLNKEYNIPDFRAGYSTICISVDQKNFDKEVSDAISSGYKPLTLAQAEVIWRIEPNQPPTKQKVLDALVSACAKYHLNVDLMKSLIKIESAGLDLFVSEDGLQTPVEDKFIRATSVTGALGLGQHTSISMDNIIARGATYLSRAAETAVRFPTASGQSNPQPLTYQHIYKFSGTSLPPFDQADPDIRINCIAAVWLAAFHMRLCIGEMDGLMVTHNLKDENDVEGNPSDHFAGLTDSQRTMLYLHGYNKGGMGTIKQFLGVQKDKFDEKLGDRGGWEGRYAQSIIDFYKSKTGKSDVPKLTTTDAKVKKISSSEVVVTPAAAGRPQAIDPARTAKLWSLNIPSYVFVTQPYGDLPSGERIPSNVEERKRAESYRDTDWNTLYTAQEIEADLEYTNSLIHDDIELQRSWYNLYQGVLEKYIWLKSDLIATNNSLSDAEKPMVVPTILNLQNGSTPEVDSDDVEKDKDFRLLDPGPAIQWLAERLQIPREDYIFLVQDSARPQGVLDAARVTPNVLKCAKRFISLAKLKQQHEDVIIRYEDLEMRRIKHTHRSDYETSLLFKMKTGVSPTGPIKLLKSFDYTYRMVSYGLIFNYFVVPVLAEMNQIHEVQVVFGELNKNATCYNPDGKGYLKHSSGDDSTAMNINIAEFAIDIEKLYNDIEEYCTRTGSNSVSVGNFMNILNSQLNDPAKGTPYYVKEADEGEEKPPIKSASSQTTPLPPAASPATTTPTAGEDDDEDADEGPKKVKGQVSTFTAPSITVDMGIFQIKKDSMLTDDALDRLEFSSSVEKGDFDTGKNLLRVWVFDSSNKASPKDLIKGNIVNRSQRPETPEQTLSRLMSFGIPIETRNLENFDASKVKNGESTIAYSGGDIENMGLRLREKQRIVENAFSSIFSTILIGVEGTCITSVNLATNTDKLDASSKMTQKTDPSQPFGSQVIPYLPERVYPAKVSMSTLGCPLFEFAQTYFINFGTHTDIDNQYGVVGITHSFTPGKFTSNIEFTPMDVYGAFRSKLDQRSLIESLEYTFGIPKR